MCCAPCDLSSASPHRSSPSPGCRCSKARPSAFSRSKQHGRHDPSPSSTRCPNGFGHICCFFLLFSGSVGCPFCVGAHICLNLNYSQKSVKQCAYLATLCGREAVWTVSQRRKGRRTQRGHCRGFASVHTHPLYLFHCLMIKCPSP